ncbi:HlyD family secretion protein [Jeongeupia chitinilytica]|uniref:Transporter n=1 Tax=Jeongeupia chitinilytica TaxID=1041641 RepID=A0ABQ3H2S3_9NEIS|nr:HlyD family secretion protein [Jeongeupia chitinilytica]GHD67342.1 transporter [Jeongeupia chitinilytica]
MTEEAGSPGKASRIGAWVVLALIAVSLLWYLAADRITPYTSQARVQTFVVPVAAELVGTVTRVYVHDNSRVSVGQPLFDVDPAPYEIALARARADYRSVESSVNAGGEAVRVAEAAMLAAQANARNAAKDAERQERLYAEDPGAISVRRLEIAQATRDTAHSQFVAAQADLRRAIEVAGEPGERNSQLASARALKEKAELDLGKARVTAPIGGVVTDLRTDTGQFVSTGAPVMAIVVSHDIWISADFTENNLGRMQPGNEVDILLDVLPGRILKGRVRSIGNGVSTGQPQPSGALPTVQNNRDWLRQAQRFPVKIEFDPKERPGLQGLRVGGQADVLAYTGNNVLMNALGWIHIRLMSVMSYLY